MQGIKRFLPPSDGGVRLELSPTTTSPLALDVSETTETRIQRLISENPVIIFSRTSCCMCHVMKRLLSTIGVHPTVIELDEDEIGALSAAVEESDRGGAVAPVVFIGGTRVGGLESLVALHLSGHLVAKLVEVGALGGMNMVL
ncbi:Glutaredoxin domain-containing protein [Heracleum sosnowskyi]|uniref:Glutaredoxin domain-containing protein n=1 Tax=Heracleum sosnowskyi TaxID=360622 RepID=A0AAD8HKF3_9APIA|nr:Glutaredoxin domain-containing protein [Heracleum sosnowskyi]